MTKQTPNMKPSTHKERSTKTGGTALGWPIEKILRGLCVCRGRSGGGLNQLYSRETSPLILIQFQITNGSSIRIGSLYLIRKKNLTEVHIMTIALMKQRAQCRPEARTRDNHRQDQDGPNHRYQ